MRHLARHDRQVRSPVPPDRTCSVTLAAAACCWRSTFSPRWSSVRAAGLSQVVDAAMVDGSALLTSCTACASVPGRTRRGSNLLDGGAPFYDTYATADGQYVAVGALEPQFYAALLHGLGLAGAELREQHDRDGWPVLRERFAGAFRVPHCGRCGSRCSPHRRLCRARSRTWPRPPRTRTQQPGARSSRPAGSPSQLRHRDSGERQRLEPAPPPRPGQDTDAVLAELPVWRQPTSQTLRDRGVVG